MVDSYKFWTIVLGTEPLLMGTGTTRSATVIFLLNFNKQDLNIVLYSHSIIYQGYSVSEFDAVMVKHEYSWMFTKSVHLSTKTVK